MKILVINGPNLNFLGIREPKLYGNVTYPELCNMIYKRAKELDQTVTIVQSNHEGEIIDEIQNAYYDKYDAIIINAGAYSHTSIAILDALKSVNLPTIEVHITDISNREEFRKSSYISLASVHSIVGHGVNGYLEALEYLNNNK